MPPHPPPWRNPRKGRNQILPSGNLGNRTMTANKFDLDVDPVAVVCQAKYIVERTKASLVQKEED